MTEQLYVIVAQPTSVKSVGERKVMAGPFTLQDARIYMARWGMRAPHFLVIEPAPKEAEPAPIDWLAINRS